MNQVAPASVAWLSYRAPVVQSVSPAGVPSTGATVTLTGANLGPVIANVVVMVNGIATAASMTTPHRVVQFRVDSVVGVTALTVVVVVGGQLATPVSVPVLPPSIDLLRLYDTSALVSTVVGGACGSACCDVPLCALGWTTNRMRLCVVVCFGHAATVGAGRRCVRTACG